MLLVARGRNKVQDNQRSWGETVQQVKTIAFERFKFQANKHLMDVCLLHNVDLEACVDWEVRDLVLKLRARILGERLVEIKYPADWWQALKDRWFPAWAKERWPVCFKTYDIAALYPLVSMPKERYFIDLVPFQAVFKD